MFQESLFTPKTVVVTLPGQEPTAYQCAAETVHAEIDELADAIDAGKLPEGTRVRILDTCVDDLINVVPVGRR